MGEQAVPLQPMEGTVGEQAVPLQPVEGNVGEQAVPLQPIEGTMGEQSVPLQPTEGTVGEQAVPLQPMEETVGEQAVPLQPMEETVGEQAVPLQPMEDRSRADLHTEAREGPHSGAGELVGATADCGGWGSTLEQSSSEGLHHKCHVRAVLEELYRVESTQRIRRGSILWLWGPDSGARED